MKTAVVVLGVWFLANAPLALASDPVTVLETKGRVQLQKKQSQEWRPLAPGAVVYPEDKVRTGADGSAKLRRGGATPDLGAESMAVVGYTSFKVQVGSLWVRLERTGQTFRVVTPTAAMAIRGTILGTQVRQDTLFVLLQGQGTLIDWEGRRPVAPNTRIQVFGQGRESSISNLTGSQVHQSIQNYSVFSGAAASVLPGAGRGPGLPGASRGPALAPQDAPAPKPIIDPGGVPEPVPQPISPRPIGVRPGIDTPRGGPIGRSGDLAPIEVAMPNPVPVVVNEVTGLVPIMGIRPFPRPIVRPPGGGIIKIDPIGGGGGIIKIDPIGGGGGGVVPEPIGGGGGGVIRPGPRVGR
ncbi:MAG: hypothetical protein HY815_16835 [Candidatus Riflebacteria bacterium]|nr:hypothetical protein [Candidatus Riflebacteria bacterium]